jgi:hypothetical protein
MTIGAGGRRCWAAFAIGLAVLVLGFANGHINGAEKDDEGPVDLRVEPWSFSHDKDGRVAPGLYWRGGLKLVSPDPRFGGFSGLALSGDGTRLLAVSDDGWWLTARLIYDKGDLANLAEPSMAPLRDRSGRRPPSKRGRDAEALTLMSPGMVDGRVAVGFERRPRIELYDLRKAKLDAKPQPVPSPPAIRNGPNNGELEALAFLGSGALANSFIAISERQLDNADNIRGWVSGKNRKTFAFTIARLDEFAVTDVAVLPDGDLMLLERSFNGLFPGLSLRRIKISELKPGALVKPVPVFEGQLPRYAIDNMEGLAVHVTASGETRITVMSDDNYNRSLQNTIILQFALRERQ